MKEKTRAIIAVIIIISVLIFAHSFGERIKREAGEIKTTDSLKIVELKLSIELHKLKIEELKIK